MSADDFFNRLMGKTPPADSQPQPAVPERIPPKGQGPVDPGGEEAVQRRQRRLAERFLDNEALTQDLDDEAANVLIDWGMDLSQRIAESTRHLADEQAQVRIDQRASAAQDMIRSAHDLALYPAALPPAVSASRAASMSQMPPADAPQGDPETDVVVPPPLVGAADDTWQQIVRQASAAYGQPLAPAANGPGLVAPLGASAAERIAGLRRLLEPGASDHPRQEGDQGSPPEQGR